MIIRTLKKRRIHRNFPKRGSLVEELPRNSSPPQGSDESETFIRRSRKRRFPQDIFEPLRNSKNPAGSSPGSGLMTLTDSKNLTPLLLVRIR
jgi:hypothetical protein